MAEKREGYFTTPDGIQLYYQVHLPVGKPGAALLVVHGAGDHSGRYQNALKNLIPQGIAVYCFDQRGYGRSPGQRGHINAWAEYRQDLRAFINLVHKEQSNLPIFLWGYSLGGLVVMDGILHDTNYLSGAIVMSAPFKPTGVAQPGLVLAARVLSLVWPKFSFKLPNQMEKVTRDPKVIQAAQGDPLMHHQASARWGTESLRTVKWVDQHPGDIYLPILIMHGEADQLDAVEGARLFYEKVTYPDKMLITYPGGYHELHNDLIKGQVLVDMVKWISRHIESPAAEVTHEVEDQHEVENQPVLAM
jgi:alpha-beta hydrolase superfamily lysophospholipase